MGAIASKIIILTIVYSTVYSDADQRKHQSSASLAFLRGIHRGPANSPHKWPVTRKMVPFDDVIMEDRIPRDHHRYPSNVLQWLDVNGGHQDSSLANGHQGIWYWYALHANAVNVSVTRAVVESIIKLAESVLMAANTFNEGNRVSWRSETWKAYRSWLLDHTRQDVCTNTKYTNEHAVNYFMVILHQR